jgi:poly(A) polymerase
MTSTIPALRDPDAIPSVATELAKMFARTGRSLYLVGGSVRGLIQHKLSGDLDFATDAAPDEVLAIVKDWHEGSWTVGIEFGTVGLMKDGHRLEITTFRGDRYDPRAAPGSRVRRPFRRKEGSRAGGPPHADEP